MNPQALHGPVKLCYEFQHLEIGKRQAVLQEIGTSPNKEGTIGEWKWYIKDNRLYIERIERTHCS